MGDLLQGSGRAWGVGRGCRRLRYGRGVRASFSKIIPFRDVFRNMEFGMSGAGILCAVVLGLMPFLF